MEHKVKWGLFVLIFIVLLLPFVQQQWPFIGSGKLKGYYTNAPDDTFTVQHWFDGTYQVGKGKYINDHIGFRPDMLRLNGQIDFSLFHKVDYGGIVVGSDNYLYFDNYVDAYFGKDFAGFDFLKERMIKLKAIQDTLTRQGKTLLLVFEPCKAWYYAEHIPQRLQPSAPLPNNYKTLLHLSDSLGINHINFNTWFLAMKDTTRELLYSRLGIHWTNYGSILAADSLAKYIDRVRNINMPYATWDEAEHTTQARMPDNDLSDIANLIYPMSTDTFCYPKLKYTQNQTTTKPNVLYIGDSYIVNMIRTGTIQHMDSNWAFLFYFRIVLDNSTCETDAYFPIAKYDWKETMKKSDCVILMYTAMTSQNIGSGFIEEAYDYYYPKK